MTRTLTLTSLLFLAAAATVRGQGCSDAGVCSAGPIGQPYLWQDSTSTIVDYRHYTKVPYSYAVGEQGVTVMQVQPELNIGFTQRLAMQVKVPLVSASGELGTNSGMGDVITTGSYAFVNQEERKLLGTVGLRLPTGRTNAISSKGPQNVITPLDLRSYALPMPYQTGLGTLDLLVGVQYRYKRWTGALAYQHVLDHGNDNQFSHHAWFNDPAVLDYFESTMLERGNDLVARAQYTYGCGRLTLQPGLLGIYRLTEDSKLVPTTNLSEGPGMTRMTIAGSSGLTINATVDLRYKLTERWAVEAMFGTPLVVREVRPDGLTRTLVTGFGLRYRF